MKYLLALVLVFLFASCGPFNGTNTPYRQFSNSGQMPTGPGCYARCSIPASYSETTIPIVVYKGTNLDDPNVQFTSVTVQEASSYWTKKKADKNCLSSNPEDCLVWCLIETPEKSYDYYTVVDTMISKQFVIENVELKELATKGGFTEWKAVVCDKDITPKMYSDIQVALIDSGYLPEFERKTNPGFNTKIKQALVKFQKENYLPIGQLDLETMNLLGVKY